MYIIKCQYNKSTLYIVLSKYKSMNATRWNGITHEILTSCFSICHNEKHVLYDSIHRHEHLFIK